MRARVFGESIYAAAELGRSVDGERKGSKRTRMEPTVKCHLIAAMLRFRGCGYIHIPRLLLSSHSLRLPLRISKRYYPGGMSCVCFSGPWAKIIGLKTDVGRLWRSRTLSCGVACAFCTSRKRRYQADYETSGT